MSGPPSGLVADIDAVERADPVSTDGYVHAYRGRLAADGTAVRLLVLSEAATEADGVGTAFERRSEQWEQLGHHPNVAAVRDCGTTPRPWLAAEAVDGEALGTAGRSLSTAAARSVVADAAEALHAASRVGLHHGELSPGHVWVCPGPSGVDGRIDWGVERACRVAAGEAAPSPYTAPELADDPAATERTDVYALGAVAYYAVTGTPPAGPHDPESSDGTGIQPPGTLDPDLSSRFEDVLLRALAADPRDRYATVYECKLGVLFGPLGPTGGSSAGVRAAVNGTASDGSEAVSGGNEPGDSTAERGDWPTRRAALGVFGLAVLGGGVLATSRLGEDSGDDLSSTASGDDLSSTASGDDPSSTASGDDPSSTASGDDPSSTRSAGRIEPPKAAFEFAFENGRLTMAHGGGDSVEAGNLLIRSDGLDSSPRRFSDHPTYEPDSSVTAGDSLAIDAEPPFTVTLVWQDGGRSVELDGFEAAAEAGIDAPDTAPDASFAMAYNENGTLGVRHEGGEAVPAEQLVFRGRRFAGAPERQWGERSSSGSETLVEPGDSLRFPAAEDVAVRLVWDSGAEETRVRIQEGVLSESGPEFSVVDQQVVLAASRGPARPLDRDAGGAPTAQYDAANSGFILSTAGPTGGVTERWLFSSRKPARPGQFASSTPSPSPAVAGGTVYAGGADGTLYAVDVVDGAELWRFRSGGSPSVTAAAGTVYTGGSNLYALDPVDGARRWLFEAEGGVSGPPRVVDGTVYVSAGDPFEWRVRAVDASDGTGQWYVDKGSGTIRPPAVVDSTVYVSADGVHALGAADGTELWYRDTDTRPVGPAVANGPVYVGEASQDGENGFVTALDRTDGSEYWRRQVPGPVHASVAVTANTVYAAGSTDSGGYVIALDQADGTTQWSRSLRVSVDDPPIVAGNTLYLVMNNTNGYVVGLDTANGLERWRYIPEDTLRGSPIAANGSLYVIGQRQTLYALADPTGE